MAKTILICDDDPTQRRLIQAVLEREGFAVLHAENGAQAIDRLTTTTGIDAVILDLVMPGQSGIDTLKEVRASGIRTPVVRRNPAYLGLKEYGKMVADRSHPYHRLGDVLVWCTDRLPNVLLPAAPSWIDGLTAEPVV